jgi:NADPH:quinone reductase-like Zn-dependent oxidoreductase
MRAVELKSYGSPVDSVEFVEVAEPGQPGAKEVLIAIEFAPINPADLLLIMGYYSVKPELPSIIGNEGVGRVIAIGNAVTNVRVGDRVAAPLSSFTWRERMVIPSERLVPLPAEADPQQLAMVAINPVTAFLLLSEFKRLSAGDWIVQTAANSGVGRSVIAIAKERGIKTVNIVRSPDRVLELLDAGADVVVVDGPQLAQEVARATGGAELAFGLDCISGTSTATLGSLLSFGGTLVSYGAMSGAPITLNPGDAIYKSLTLRSFFIGHDQYAEKIPALIDQAAQLMAKGKLQIPVTKTYPLRSIKDAIAHAQQGGKILLDVAAV